jgi:membrane-associated phospholipid phosphatase
MTTASSKLATRIRTDRPRKTTVAEARAPGLLAKWPIIGLAMFLFGSLAFGALTYNLLAHGPLLAWDVALAQALPAIGLQSPPFVRILMEAGFYMGNDVLLGLGALLGLYFIIKRDWQRLAMMAIGAGGSSVLFFSISNLIGRARPTTQIWNILHIPGFPSGHAAAVVVFFGLMAYWLVQEMSSAFWKGMVIAAALFLIGFVGFSRVFTGGHYLTDVLAGYSVGFAWSGACYTLIEMYFQKRRSLNVKKE